MDPLEAIFRVTCRSPDCPVRGRIAYAMAVPNTGWIVDIESRFYYIMSVMPICPYCRHDMAPMADGGPAGQERRGKWRRSSDTVYGGSF